VHCGIDLDRFSPVVSNSREQLHVACVGRLVPEKGQRLLIEAIATMCGAGHAIRLTLVGDGPQRASLEELVRELGVTDKVDFLGAVAHTQVEYVLQSTDVFCLPSFAEGVPIVLMEAMAMELPVVASQVMGIPELIEDRVNGRLVRPGSRADLVDALTWLATDPDGRKALGRAARVRVAAEFDVHANAICLRQIYSAALGFQVAPTMSPAHSHTT
jgi:glycosyltransferase involved in cell wall biosynthesis